MAIDVDWDLLAVADSLVVADYYFLLAYPTIEFSVKKGLLLYFENFVWDYY